MINKASSSTSHTAATRARALVEAADKPPSPTANRMVPVLLLPPTDTGGVVWDEDDVVDTVPKHTWHRPPPTWISDERDQEDRDGFQFKVHEAVPAGCTSVDIAGPRDNTIQDVMVGSDNNSDEPEADDDDEPETSDYCVEDESDDCGTSLEAQRPSLKATSKDGKGRREGSAIAVSQTLLRHGGHATITATPPLPRSAPKLPAVQVLLSRVCPPSPAMTISLFLSSAMLLGASLFLDSN